MFDGLGGPHDLGVDTEGVMTLEVCQLWLYGVALRSSAGR